MASAEIITIGTEILLGEIVDTNTRHIALTLRDLGVDLYRTITIGDNTERIASAIRDSMERCRNHHHHWRAWPNRGRSDT